jgi:hypothetical protein
MRRCLSHIALINSAFNPNEAVKPARQRADGLLDNRKVTAARRIDRLLTACHDPELVALFFI